MFPNASWPPVSTGTTTLNILIMKTAAIFKFFAASVIFASVLASCSKDILSDDRPVEVYTFALSDDGTRAVLAESARGKYGHWEQSDRLGTAVASGNPGYSFVNVGTPSTFSIYRPGGLTAGEMLYVYYPYNKETASVNAVQFEIPEAQYQTGVEFDFDAMPLAAAPYEIKETVANDKYSSLGDIHMYNLAAMAEFKLYSTNADFRSEVVTGVRFEADAAVAGAFSKDITAITAEDESSLAIAVSDYNWVETTVISAPALGAGADDAFCVYMVLAPGSYSGKLIVTTETAEYTYTITTAQQFRRSIMRSFRVDLAAGERKADDALQYLGCYEVPAMTPAGMTSGEETFGTTSWFAYTTDDDTRRVVTHTYMYESKLYRNYTAMVDQTRRCPVWTAYVMHGGSYPNNDVKRGSFNVQTSYDPAIPRDWQSSGSTADYNNGNGYSRGHHCASEDRQTCKDANDQTFYYTNQSPQWQNSFNGGIWASLEGVVQSKSYTLSSSDSLYVVVGTLFENGNYGSSNDGGEVARPSHFYKLLMLCHFDSSGKISSAQGAAYLYENKANSGKYSDAKYVTTIDAIEQRSGFDFFPRVPAAIQEAAESAYTAFL